MHYLGYGSHLKIHRFIAALIKKLKIYLKHYVEVLQKEIIMSIGIPWIQQIVIGGIR